MIFCVIADHPSPKRGPSGLKPWTVHASDGSFRCLTSRFAPTISNMSLGRTCTTTVRQPATILSYRDDLGMVDVNPSTDVKINVHLQYVLFHNFVASSVSIKTELSVL